MKFIKEWPSLRKTFEFRSFLGLPRFYRNFIRNFNGICARIVETIKKDNQPFRWTTTARKSFKLLKEKITKNLVLALPYFNKLF